MEDTSDGLDLQASDATAKPGYTVPDGEPDLSTSIGLKREDLERYLDDAGEAAIEAQPEDSYTAQSHDSRDEDGNHTLEIYDQPAFRQNDDGDWVPLDAAVEASDEPGAAAVAENTLAATTFGDSSSKLLTFDVGDRDVVVSAPDLSVSDPRVEGSTVTYPDVAPGADLEYVVGPSYLKESVLLESESAPRSYTFHLADPRGTLGQPQPDGVGGWVFTGAASDAPELRIPAGVAYEDRPGADLEALFSVGAAPSAHVEVAGAGDGFDITVRLDDEWASAHTFPIVLDPSWAWGHPGSGTTGVGTQYDDPNGNLQRDGFHGYSYKPTSGCAQPTTCIPFTTNQYLVAGTQLSYNAQGVRSYLHFPYDLSSATHREDFKGTILNVPLRAQVDFSGLWLRFVGCYQPSPATTSNQPCAGATRGIDTYNMTGSWSPASTYAQLQAAMAAQPENQDASGIPTWSEVPKSPNNYRTIDEGNGYHSALSYYPPDPNPWFPNTGTPQGYDTHAWQLLTTTGIVQDWVNDPATAYGLGIKMRNETPPTGSTGTGSYWYSATPVPAGTAPASDPPAANSDNPQQVFPLLQVDWHATKANAPTGLTPTVNGSAVTTGMNQSTTGTYAFAYDSWLMSAGTNTAVAKCQDNLSSPTQHPNQVQLNDRVGCQFDTPIPAGEYYLASAAWNEAGYSPLAYSGRFRVGAAPDADGTMLGLEPWWTFEQRNVGPDATASVNVANGNLVVQQTDGTPIQGHGGLAYVLRRTYNSQANTSIGLGGNGIAQGWSFNISAAGDATGVIGTGLQVPPDLNTVLGNVTLVDRDGTRHAFTYDSTALAIDLGQGSNMSIPLSLQGLLGSPTAFGATVTQLLGVANNTVSTLANNPLALANLKVCLDTSYRAPAGVHLALWRFVGVALNGSCADAHSPTPSGLPVNLGYVAVSPDRQRQTFAVTGQLLSLNDKAGNELRYVYDPTGPAGVQIGPLKFVYEPKNCPQAISNDWLYFTTNDFDSATPTTCRHFSFRYNGLQLHDTGLTSTTVFDPAGRQTTYNVSGVLGLGQLTSVETKTSSGATIGAWKYSYCGTPQKLCSITDPNGVTDSTNATKHQTTFTYQAGRVRTLTERNGATTADLSAAALTSTFDYDQPVTSGQVATDVRQGTQRNRRYVRLSADLNGRAVELDEGTRSANSTAPAEVLQKTTYDWDVDVDGSCLLPTNRPDAVPDNNLCRTTRYAGVVTLDNVTPPDAWDSPADELRITDYDYNPEGRILRTREGDGSSWLETRNTYDTTYWGPDSTPVYGFTDVGGAAVTRDALYTPNPADPTNRALWTRKPVLYAISDLTSTISPGGRVTNLALDNNWHPTAPAPAVQPWTLTPTCGTGNTGLVCSETKQRTAPDGGDLVTTYTYDGTFGQRLTMTKPEGDTYRYLYYADTDTDLSTTVSAGGWLKAVIDPGAHATSASADLPNAVVFAYDRAGNQVRAWDRNSTNRLRIGNASRTADSIVAAFPGSVAAPPTGPKPDGTGTGTLPYIQTLYSTESGAAAYANPTRYVTETKDQLGNRTTYDVDLNGNPGITTAPRGNVTGNTTNYKQLRIFNSRDQLITEGLPNGNAYDTTSYGYDEAGNRNRTTDPNGNITAVDYDAANRKTRELVARGNWTGTNPEENCEAGTAPFASTKKVCATRTYYDGAGQPYLITTAEKGATLLSVDYVGRTTDTFTYRSGDKNDEDNQPNDPDWLHKAQAFDGDGNVTLDCPATQFDHTPTASCGGDGTNLKYSTARTYDGAGLLRSEAHYRETAADPGASSQPFSGWDTRLTTSWNYDRNGNQTQIVRPDTLTEIKVYDNLDRLETDTSPRTNTTSTTHSYTYDPSGNQLTDKLVSSETPTRQSLKVFTYDDANRPIDSIDAATGTNPATLVASLPDDTNVQNLRTRNFYDSDGNLVGQLEPRAFVSPFSSTNYDKRFLTRVDYDQRGRQAAMWTPFYETTSGSPYQVIATNGAEVTDCPTPSTYHKPQDITGVPTFDSTTGICAERRTYDLAGNIKTERNKTGSARTADGTDFVNKERYTEYFYGDNNLLTQVTGPNPTGSTGTSSHPAETGLTGRVRQATYSYDVMGRESLMVDPSADGSGTANAGYDWHKTSTYYKDGLLRGTIESSSDTSHDSASTKTTGYRYDADGRQVRIKETANNTLGTVQINTTSYFADGTTFQSTLGTNSASPDDYTTGSTTRYARDRNGNETKVWSPSAVAGDATNPGRLPTLMTFTSDGLLTSMTEPVTVSNPTAAGDSRRITDYKYDALGNKTEQSVRQEALQAGGTWASTTVPKLQFDYNDNGSVRQETGRDGKTIQYRYWANGAQYKTIDNSSGTNITTEMKPYLNGLPRSTSLTGVTQPTYQQFRWYADGLEYQRTSFTDATYATSDMSEAFVYSNARQLTQVWATGWSAFSGGLGIWQFTYDRDGRVATIADAYTPSPRVTTNTWDENGTLLNRQIALTAGGSSIQQWTYQYDAMKRITSQASAPAGGTEATFSYTYDPQGRVWTFSAGTTTSTITYDRNGNRKTYGGSGATYRADNSLRSQTYDPAGRQTSTAGGTNIYDGFDRLCGVATNGQVPCPNVAGTKYTYDGLNRQIDKTTSTETLRQRYIGSTNQLLSETNSTNSVKTGRYFSTPNAPIAVINVAATPTLEYLNDNGHGDIALATKAGTTASAARGCAVRYDPWGQPTSAAGAPLAGASPCYNASTTVNTLWYGSALRDSGTKNYRMGDRNYQPDTGTWLTPDDHRAGSAAMAASIGTDPLLSNRYAYVNGDPINLRDPSGHHPCADLNGSAYKSCMSVSASGHALASKREGARWKIVQPYLSYLRRELSDPDGRDRLIKQAGGDGCASLAKPTNLQEEIRKDEHVVYEQSCPVGSFVLPDWLGFLVKDQTIGAVMKAVPQPGVDIEFRVRTKVTVIYENGGATVTTESGVEHRVCTTFGIPFLSFCPLGPTPWAVLPGTQVHRTQQFVPNVTNPFTPPPFDGDVPVGQSPGTIPGGEPTGRPGGFYDPGTPST